MRPDKTVSILLSKIPGLTKNNNKIPILMYHSVVPEITQKVHPYFVTEITPQKFEQHLAFLKDNEYNVISLSELNGFKKENSNRSKYVVITFDDGYEDFYQHAFPLLRQYGFPATVFLPAELIGTRNKLENKTLMSWEQVKECRKHSIEFGSHSLSHGRLIFLNKELLEYDLKKSKSIIEEKLSEVINTFSYPYKFPEDNTLFVDILLQLLENTGYCTAVTTRIGRVSSADHDFLLKRLPVNEFDDAAFLRAKLCGAYDWIYFLQFISKVVRSNINFIRQSR